jgi:hypothetical protein
MDEPSLVMTPDMIKAGAQVVGGALNDANEQAGYEASEYPEGSRFSPAWLNLEEVAQAVYNAMVCAAPRATSAGSTRVALKASPAG